MKTRRERLLLILLAVLCIYAITVKESISEAFTTIFMPNEIVVAAHTCKGEYTGGPYVGWYADSTSHWVTCSCGTQMKGIGSTTKGVNSHSWNGNQCRACGYTKLATPNTTPNTTPKATPKATPKTTPKSTPQLTSTPQASSSVTTHTCKGTVKGSYNGWFADERYHWVECTCGKEIKSLNGTKSGRNSHSWSNNKCTTCEYKKVTTSQSTPKPVQTPVVTSTPSTHEHVAKYNTDNTYNGWFIDGDYHYIKCTKCTVRLTYDDQNWVSNKTLVTTPKGSKHVLDKSTGKCSYCKYPMTAHTCKGEYTGGTYAGWFADSNGHWVMCANCDNKMTGIGSTTKGKVAHKYDSNGICKTCGWKKAGSTTGTGTGTSTGTTTGTPSHTHTIKYGQSANNGWFADSTGHYMKCTGCDKLLTYKNINNTSSGLKEEIGSHVLNKATGKCTYCYYPMSTTGGQGTTGDKDIKEYTVTAKSTNQISISGDGKFQKGMIVTLTATPASGYGFGSWSGIPENAIISGSFKSTTISFTMPAKNLTVSATHTFGKQNGNVKKYAVKATGPKYMQISGAGEYSEGDIVTLTATVDSGYSFKKWTVSQSNKINMISSDLTQNTISFFMPAKNVSVSATAEQAKSNLTIEYYVDGQLNGKSQVQKVGVNKQISKLVGTTRNKKSFVKWEVEGTSNYTFDSNGRKITLTMPENDVTIKAMYGSSGSGVSDGETSIVGYQVTTNDKAKNLTLSGGGKYSQGQIVTLTATATAGYSFKRWNISPKVDVISGDLTSASISFVMPAKNVKANATAEQAKSNLTIEYYVDGQLNGKSQVQKVGVNKQISKLAGTTRNKKQFEKWEVEGTGNYTIANDGRKITLTMPENDVTIKAMYGESEGSPVENRYLLSTKTSCDGKFDSRAGTVRVTTPGNGTYVTNHYNAGEKITLIATPGEGYSFKEWSSNEISISNNTAQITTITMPAKNITIEGKFTKNALGDVHGPSALEKWEYDEKYHWKPCFLTLCDNKYNIGKHNIVGDKCTVCQYAPDMYKLTIKVDAPSSTLNSIVTTGAGTYKAGSKVEVKADNHGTGSEFSHWLVNGVGQGNKNPLTITMPSKDTIVTAVFKTNSIDIHGPSVLEKWETNEQYHWKPCFLTFCNNKYNYGKHDMVGGKCTVCNYTGMYKVQLKYTFGMDEGLVEYSNKEYKVGDKVSLVAPDINIIAPERKNYEFMMWTTSLGKLDEDVWSSKSITFTMPNKDVSFVAWYDYQVPSCDHKLEWKKVDKSYHQQECTRWGCDYVTSNSKARHEFGTNPLNWDECPTCGYEK